MVALVRNSVTYFLTYILTNLLSESADIRKGVDDFDIEAIGLTAISSIEKFLPTAEEIAALNSVVEKNKMLIVTEISENLLGSDSKR